MADFATSFARETWAMYGVGMFMVVLRYIARIRRFGITGLKFDDYMMLNGVVWYTILCVAFNKVASGGGSNFMTAEEEASLTPAIIKERISGSKWVVVSEHSMLIAIWSMKACMLHLYASITEGLPQRKWVKFVAVYTVMSFVGSEIALFTACRPFTEYWAVPVENSQCATYQYFEIIQGCLSIPGDIAMLAIGIPILAAIRLPLQQKAILLFIFGMGFFIVVSAILTKVYCLVPSLISYVYMNWYFREASVAVYVTNLPTIWPLLREIFPRLQTWGSRSKTTRSASKAWGGTSSRARINSKDFGMKSLGGMKGTRAESQERIKDDSDSSKSVDARIEIQKDVSFQITTESASQGPGDTYGTDGWKNSEVKTTVRGV